MIKILNYIGFTFGLLPFIAAIVNYKNLNKTLKIAAIFFLIAFFVDFLLWLNYLRYIKMENNHPFLYLSIIINITFYTTIYYRSFYINELKKFTILAGMAVLTTILIFIFKYSIWSYPTWENTILCFYMIVISLLYFYQIFQRQEFIEIEKQPLFWINSGVLIYFSFTIFLYMLLKKIQIKDFLIINAITNIISNLLFTIGLSCKPPKTT